MEMTFHDRRGAADLLHFCLSRVKLDPLRARDGRLLDELPSLMSTLRICTLPLFMPINAATKVTHPPAPPTTPLNPSTSVRAPLSCPSSRQHAEQSPHDIAAPPPSKLLARR